MQILIEIDEARFKDIQRIAEVQLESNHFQTAEQIIAKGVPIEQEQKWIPISERLPKIHQDVLLSLRSLDVEVGFKAETEPYFYHYGYIDPQNVLAWMPLPEPYKADEEVQE